MSQFNNYIYNIGINFMKKRSKKLIGTILIVFYLIIYALIAMKIGTEIINQTSNTIKIIYYCTSGIVWIIPVMMIIKKIEK